MAFFPRGMRDGYVLIGLVALLVTLALIVVAVVPRLDAAEAHDTPDNCVGPTYGGILRAVACTHGGHTWLDGCDRASDGLRTRAWEWLGYPYDPQPGSWDPNGANPGCANDPTIGPFLRSCVEQPVGCTGWANK